ncbi:MAG: bifunctional 2-polyprenyl-6-hydroxyphenol methylase/3-demethylubiquinol 3-O-methyltransferase UbiG [Hyphomicrobiales bacterium]|nr:bifunctional 2-polyprenyl-6-hydroxyphenol methylase/3-demethylubiquinol 3-O-methyltransferase UbiG [Hyphomicrobiales bacterium]
MAARWWDPAGPMKPLHRLNPVRIDFLRTRALERFARADAPGAFAGLTALDVGCGGGIVSEPMARQGFAMTGIDAARATIAAARRHAEDGGLDIDYRVATVAELADEGRRFDLVLALEVVEHVVDPARFVAELARVVAPGGLVALSTINRTALSYALAIVGAEYVLRWVPRGTHDWSKFVTPAELAGFARAAGLAPDAAMGLAFDPLSRNWRLTPDRSVNYFLTATPAAA